MQGEPTEFGHVIGLVTQTTTETGRSTIRNQFAESESKMPRKSGYTALSRQVLSVLRDAPVEDAASGLAFGKLFAIAGIETKVILRGVLNRLDDSELIERDVRATRCYRIAITDKGRAALRGKTAKQNPATATAAMPPGPASQWSKTAPSETSENTPAPKPATAPAPPRLTVVPTPKATSEMTLHKAAGAGGLDYQTLAEEMILAGARGLALESEHTELQLMLAEERKTRKSAEEAAAKAEQNAKAAVEAQFAGLRAHIADRDKQIRASLTKVEQLTTELKIAREQIETLEKKLELADRRTGNGTTIGERIPLNQAAVLTDFRDRLVAAEN